MIQAPNTHAIKDVFIHSIIIVKMLHSVLPPWDWDASPFADFPRLQSAVRRTFNNRYYKLMITVMGFASLTLRTAIWQASIERSQKLNR